MPILMEPTQSERCTIINMTVNANARSMETLSAPGSPRIISKECRRSIFGDYWDSLSQRKGSPPKSPPPGKQQCSFKGYYWLDVARGSQSTDSRSTPMPKSILRRRNSDKLSGTVSTIDRTAFIRRARSDSLRSNRNQMHTEEKEMDEQCPEQQDNHAVHFDPLVSVREFIVAQEEKKERENWFTADELEQFRNEAVEQLERFISLKSKGVSDDQQQETTSSETKDEPENERRKIAAKRRPARSCAKQLHPSFFFV